jgi:hypothetical protein
MPLQFQKLSFYGREDLAAGSIVPIVFNNRPMYGIVLESAPLQNLKQSIKSSPFTMKKLDLTPDTIIVPNTRTLFIMNIADITLQNPGKLYWHFFGENPLSELVVAPLPEGGSATAVGGGSNKSQNLTPALSWRGGGVGHIAATEQNFSEILSVLQQLDHNAIIVCPSTGYVESLKQRLPKLQIITPVELPRLLVHYPTDTVPYIYILHASDSLYISHQRSPYIDYREIILPAVQYLSPQSPVHIIDTYIDTRCADIFKLPPSQIIRDNVLPGNVFHLQHNRENRYYDTMFSTDMFAQILSGLETGKRIMIITSRKGLSSSVSCSNCAFIARCGACNHVQAMVRKTKTGERSFLCHQCHTKSPVYDMCLQCDGLLSPLGYTTQSIYETLQNLDSVKNIPMSIIDSDTTKSYKKLTRQLEHVPSGSIIITTPGMAPYITNIDIGIVVSLEGLLAAPAYDQDSYVYRIIRKLSNQCGQVYIQSKSEKPDNIITTSTQTFFNTEYKNSQDYRVPPVYTHLDLSIKIPKNTINNQVVYIQDLIKDYVYMQYINTRILEKKGRDVIISHKLSFPTKYWTDFQNDLGATLNNYGIRKNTRRI